MAMLTAPQRAVFGDLLRYNCQVVRSEYDGRRGVHFTHYDAVSSDPRGYFTVRATVAKALIAAGLLVPTSQAGRYAVRQEAN